MNKKTTKNGLREKSKYTSLISVVVPGYNHGEYLSASIESVLNQTYGNLECIMIDDGSNDNTEEIVKTYISGDNRVKYFRQENKGPSAARNLGIKKAKGELITFLDADDWLNTNLYETQIQCIRENKLSDKNFVIYADHKIVWKNREGHTVKEKLNRPGKLSKQELIKKMLGVERGEYPPLHFNCSLIKKDVFNGIRFAESLPAYEDLYCWYNILISDAEFKYVPVIGMYYRRHLNNLTTNKERMRKGYLMCFEKISSLNSGDVTYMQDMDEMLKYFSIVRDRERLDRVIFIIRNSPVPVYSKSDRNIKKMLLILDKINLLNSYLYALYIFHNLFLVKRQVRVKISEKLRDLTG